MTVKRAPKGRVERGDGYLPEVQTIQVEEGKMAAGLAYLLSVVSTVVRALNGRIEFGDGTTGTGTGNLFGEWRDVVTPSVADTEFTVPHELDRLATAYEVARRDKACSVYDSSAGSWTRDRIKLKCDVGSVSLKLRIY